MTVDPFRLDGRVALVTGAGSGIGRATALALAAAGALVVVSELAAGGGEETVEAIRAADGEARFRELDVTDEAGWHRVVEGVLAEQGRLDVLVNNAGIAVAGPVETMSLADWRRQTAVNLDGVFLGVRAVLPAMKPGSRLALVASIAGLTSNYAYAAYGASKFGVVGLATTLRYEYEPQGIHISCICPPEVKTPMVEKERADANPVSLELKALAGSLEADSACDQIVAGLDAGRWQIIPGFLGKLTAFGARYLPGPFNAIMLRLIGRALRKHGMDKRPV
jgi:3-dehydrosphinganine reductase